MSVKNINDAFIINEFQKENISLFGKDPSFDNTKAAIRHRFPSLSNDECNSLIDIFKNIYLNNQNNTELTVTAPNSFKLKNMTTYSQIEKLIDSAQKQIILTGYSISNYFDNFIDKIINKSQKGILVKLYLNEFENTELENKLKLYIGKHLRVYVFNKNVDKMSALHAKIISVDNQTSLVSSANLSYHGLQGNIEIGTLITSNTVANQIKDLLEQLLFQKVFKEIT